MKARLISKDGKSQEIDLIEFTEAIHIATVLSTPVNEPLFYSVEMDRKTFVFDGRTRDGVYCYVEK